MGSALLGSGLGYGVGETWFGGGGNFFLNMQGFYMGLFGSSKREISAGDRPGTRFFANAGNTQFGTVPNIWGGLSLPAFEFGWELTGTVDKMILLNTIHLMGVSDYDRGRYLIEQVSGDPDERVYAAKGDFIIPSAPENGRNQLEITSSGIQGGNTAMLDGNILKESSVLLSSKGGKISISATPNTNIIIQRSNYRERQRQINQYGQPFEYHLTIKPNLNFDVKQYGSRTYNRWRFKIFGIKTIGKKTP